MPSRLKEMRIFMLTLSLGSTHRRHPRTDADTFPKLLGPVVTGNVGVYRRRAKAPAERSAVCQVLRDLLGYIGLLWSLFRRRRCSSLLFGPLALLFWLCFLGAWPARPGSLPVLADAAPGPPCPGATAATAPARRPRFKGQKVLVQTQRPQAISGT